MQAGDDGVSLYVTNVDSAVAYQHVIYSPATGFFENMTLCNDTTLSDLNRALINVHTSQIPSHPSYVLLHNYASSGDLKGTIVLAAEPNTS